MAAGYGLAAARSSHDEEPALTPKLYGELAGWFHVLTPPGEYAEEAAIYRRLLDGAGDVRTVLELGSGGGNNASHLKAHYRMTLVDVAPEMITMSRAINPECEHLVGDMRTVRLDRNFDAVFIHDAIDYMVTLDDLRDALRTARVHLRPGGVALFCPDHLRDTFQPSTDHGGTDEGQRGLRYLEWTWVPDPADTRCITDYAYLLREGEDVRVEHDRHVCGLFSREQWMQTLGEVGFRESRVHPGPEGVEVFLALS
jgi:SAM-dependent methyltransferase